MRGVTPNGVSAPCGDMIVILSPTRRLRCSASLAPTATPCPSSKPCERPLRDVAADAGQALEIRPRGCRAPARRTSRRARWRSAWPSTSGSASVTPGNLADAIGHRLVVGQRRLDPLQEHVAVEADHLLHEVMAEAVHHRHDDDQRRDPEHDAEEGKAGDDGDRLLGVARAQIAERDHPFEGRERPRRPRRRGDGLDGRGHARAPAVVK